MNENYYKKRIEELENEDQDKHNPYNVDYATTAAEIREKIQELRDARKGIFNAATEKGLAISNYDRMLAITVLKLKNRLIKEMSDPETGEVIPIPVLPATSLTVIAKGICWMHKGREEESEAMYKAIISNIDAIKSELNGLQSINKNIQ